MVLVRLVVFQGHSEIVAAVVVIAAGPSEIAVADLEASRRSVFP